MSNTNIVLTNANDLNAHIVEISKTASKLIDQIQLGLVSSVYQIMHGRNTNHLNALMIAAGRGTRKTAIAQWALAHAPVMLETDKEKMKTHPFRFDAAKVGGMLIAADLMASDENAEATAKAVTPEMAEAYAVLVNGVNWADYKEPPLVPESWSLLDAVKKLLAQATQYEGKGVKVAGADMKHELNALLAAAQARASAPAN